MIRKWLENQRTRAIERRVLKMLRDNAACQAVVDAWTEVGQVNERMPRYIIDQMTCAKSSIAGNLVELRLLKARYPDLDYLKEQPNV